MAFTEDLNLFLSDFGVTCTAGAVTGTGILDMPSQVVADGMVLTTDYMLTARSADFGGLLYGDGITVNGANYQVRDVRQLDDGAFVEVSLQKLAANQTIVGSQVASIGLSDLSDVAISAPTTGDTLTFNGTEWVNTDSYSVGPE